MESLEIENLLSADDTSGEPDDIDMKEIMVKVHYWDFVFAILYALLLMFNLAGIANYSIQAPALTVAIMITSVLAICCKCA